MNSKYPHLLSPGKIGSVELRNRTVMTIGEKPDASLYEELKDKLPEVYNIGDSNGGGILPNAVYEGYTVGMKI